MSSKRATMTLCRLARPAGPRLRAPIAAYRISKHNAQMFSFEWFFFPALFSHKLGVFPQKDCFMYDVSAKIAMGNAARRHVSQFLSEMHLPP